MDTDLTRDENKNNAYKMSFILAFQNSLYSLTGIAEQKGSVLLGFNFLIISFIVTQMVLHGPRVDLLIILFFSLTIVLLAIRALLPRLSLGEHVNVNLLFFNEIANLDESAFSNKMLDLLKSEKGVYLAIMRNIHQISMILERKYKYLRLAYRVCFVGCALGIALLVFALFNEISILLYKFGVI